jgi:hypothetical protein
MLQKIRGLGIILKLSVAIAILIISVDMQQANADNNNVDSKKSCNNHHDSGSSQCAHKDTTPFILPFP